MPRLSVTAPFGFDFDTERFLRAYAALGCRSCQFYRNVAKPPTVESARRTAAAAGLTFDSIHGVFGDDCDPSNPDEAIRTDSLRIYKREGELAVRLGGPRVVVHPSGMVPPGADNAARDPASQDVRLRRIRESLEDLAGIGEELEVIYLVENIPHGFWMGDDSSAVADWVRRLDSPYVRMCFDTGHAHMERARFGDVASQLRRCLDVVAYIHVNDNDGAKDDHRLPGEGTIDWSSVGALLRDAPDDLYCMLEVFHPEAQIERLAAAGLGERIARALGIR